MANVVLPARTWVDLYAATGIIVGTQLSVHNITPNDVRLVTSATEPSGTDDHIPLVYGRGVTAENETGDPGAWALCVGGGAVDVKEVTP